ncbi:MAG: hypothetical protein MJA29_08595, partial [Candidatus Omnitrophica bacterium]|nr:hypothetical protein [Candidatus Omnitrophota bacterium]
MNFTEFREKTQDWPLIPAREAVRLGREPQAMRNQLTRWQKRGLLVALKRGLYLLNARDRKVQPGRFFLSNQLMTPSYISMESALQYYGFIPEAVADVTAITTRKTVRFGNDAGMFLYQHIKPEAFRGFLSKRDESGQEFFIASPEKAVVDFLYLNLTVFSTAAPDVFRA